MYIDELDTPAVVVDLDALESNLRSMAEYAAQHNLSLRPHTKTHKIPAIAHMQRQYGSAGITVAKTGEAEVMASADIDDILVHYPVLGEGKDTRLADLARTSRITVALDGVETARMLGAAATKAGSTIHILAEIDSGMGRCGVSSVDELARLGGEIDNIRGLQLDGITTYPGHIWAAPPDQGPALKSLADLFDGAREAFRKAGLSCDVVSAGSTPTARQSHLVGSLTEMRPGTYAFNDRNTLGVGACTLAECALRVVVTVVSTAVPGGAIIDGGSKTFTSDRWISGNTGGHGYVVEQPEVSFRAMSEEHGHLSLADSSYVPKIGDRLSVIPNHVCGCVNMHDEIYFHRKGEVEGSWSVAGRGRLR